MSKRDKAKGVTEVGLEVLLDSLAQQIARKTGEEIVGELQEAAKSNSPNPELVAAQRFYIDAVENLLGVAFPHKTSVKPKHVAKLTGWTKGQAKRFLREPESITLMQLQDFAICAGYVPKITLTDLVVNNGA